MPLKPYAFQNAGFSFLCQWKTFWNEAVQKQWGYNFPARVLSSAKSLFLPKFSIKEHFNIVSICLTLVAHLFLIDIVVNQYQI